MSLGLAPVLGGGEEEEEPGEIAYPPAPFDDSFDVATTVDPAYIISLIRKLLGRKKFSPGKPQGICDGIADSRPAKPKDDGSEESGLLKSEVADSISRDGRLCHESQDLEVLVPEQTWEEAGCILWDLAANKTIAEFMVHNFLLDVLLASLMDSQSIRIKEISLGIMGNIACHEELVENIISTDGLIEVIIEHFFVDDSPCLSEAFRLLTAGLQSIYSISWAKALHSEHVIGRLLWVAENTLNLNLTEKSTSLLLAVIENGQVASILLPTMMKLGLPDILVNLLSFEMEHLVNARNSERYTILDLVLRSVEALSTIHEYSSEICSRKELWKMASDLVKFSDKVEVSSSCVTAAVLIANILTDVVDGIPKLSADPDFLCGLVDILPFASGDLEARAAVWSVLAWLLDEVQGSNLTPSSLLGFILALAKRVELIEDDLLEDGVYVSSTKLVPRDKALRNIVEIYDQWATSVCERDDYPYEACVKSLLELCWKHVD